MNKSWWSCIFVELVLFGLAGLFYLIGWLAGRVPDEVRLLILMGIISIPLWFAIFGMAKKES